MSKQQTIIPPGTAFYDYEYYPQSQCTVVAMNATLDDFKAQPINKDGKPMTYFKERTIKDCRGIDGCIYFHLGRVDDSVLVELIEKFQKVKREMKDWRPKGRLAVRDGKIMI